MARPVAEIRSLAQRIYAFRPIARQWGVEPFGNSHCPRPGLGSVDDRQLDRTRTPAFGRGTKKAGLQGIGRSRGGLMTKIRATVDALGNPVRIHLTGGAVADILQAESLIDGFDAEAVIADKGYDADSFIATVEASKAHAVIPPKSN